jgi:hypothetical protein
MYDRKALDSRYPMVVAYPEGARRSQAHLHRDRKIVNSARFKTYKLSPVGNFASLEQGGHGLFLLYGLLCLKEMIEFNIYNLMKHISLIDVSRVHL